MDEETAQAVADLLPADQRTGDDLRDLIAAGTALEDARRAAPGRGGVIVRALHAWGLSWRQIEVETGIDHRTARRWAGQR